MANIVNIAKTVGANRIVPTISIPYPLGHPNKSNEEQLKLRKYLVNVALHSLETEIKEATVFEVQI